MGNWDRKGPKKQSSNSDHKEKAKKHFKRSISMETKNSSQGSGFKSGQNQNKVHRSFSTMDGYVGVGPVRGFGPPMATLPKIPKLKKSGRCVIYFSVMLMQISSCDAISSGIGAL